MAATPWVYDHQTGEWSRRYDAHSFASCHLAGRMWDGALVCGRDRETIVQRRDSKTAKKELDQAYREHSAASTAR
jgi:hypothetical protein